MAAPQASDLLALFPEFSDTTKYPTATLQAWLNVATNFVNERRWGETWSFGVCLFAAHEIALARQARIVSSAGGVPGTTVGVVSSKSVGPLSKSYDTSIAKYSDAGFWNLTTYGQQYWGLMLMFGAGGIQLGMLPGCGDRPQPNKPPPPPTPQPVGITINSESIAIGDYIIAIGQTTA